MAETDQAHLREFKAPSWTVGWCPRCEFTAACAKCRHAPGLDLDMAFA